MLKHIVIANSQKAAAYFIDGDTKAAPRPVVHMTQEFAKAADIREEPVSQPILIALLAGFSPQYQQLRMRTGSGAKRGDEFTLTTDKTLGLAACFFPERLAGAVVEAHRRAAGAVIGLMQSSFSASVSRLHRQVHFSRHALSLEFCHFHNRLNEPHIHSHIVSPNLLWVPELGRITNCNVLFAAKQVPWFDRIYNLLVRDELLRLGVAAVIDGRGFCTIPALEPMREAFSTPHRRIMERVRAIEREEGRAVGYEETFRIWEKMRPAKPKSPEPAFGKFEDFVAACRIDAPPPPPPPPLPPEEIREFVPLVDGVVAKAIFERLRAGRTFDVAEAAPRIAEERKRDAPKLITNKKNLRDASGKVAETTKRAAKKPKRIATPAARILASSRSDLRHRHDGAEQAERLVRKRKVFAIRQINARRLAIKTGRRIGA